MNSKLLAMHLEYMCAHVYTFGVNGIPLVLMGIGYTFGVNGYRIHITYFGASLLVLNLDVSVCSVGVVLHKKW